MKRTIVILALCALAAASCKKENQEQTKSKKSSGLVRLESLLNDSQTTITGGIQMTPANFEAFEGNGWELKDQTISAVNRRAVLILPETPPGVQKATLRFRASAPEAGTRQLVISSKDKEIRTVHLTNEWQDYQIDLSNRDLKRLRFVFDGRKKSHQSFGDFAGFHLKFYGHSQLKIANEVRPAIVVPASSGLTFQLQLPSGKPVLTLGAGLQGVEQDQKYQVSVGQEPGKIRTVADFEVSPAKWYDRTIDLQEYAGKKVRLELKPSAGTTHEGLVAWSSPEIYDSSASNQKPNVILFSIDALRPDHLSYEGYPVPTSPNLDTLAARSMVFSQAYCTSPSTLPSHASIMTGLYPAKHHVGKKTKMIRRLQTIPETLITLAELAMQQDYKTAAITDDGYVSGFYGFAQGFQKYVENDDVGKNDEVRTIDDGISWLRKQDRSRPFLLFLHSYEVHEPFTPPLRAFRHLFPKHPLKEEKSPEIYNEWLKKVMIGEVIPTADEKDLVRKAFDAEIYFFDQQFGRFLHELKNLKLDQNTILIIFSDHGQQFFERGNAFGHASSLQLEEIRVPLIIHIPGKNAEKISRPVSLVDIYPTVAHIIGASAINSELDGVNLLSADTKKNDNRTIYYEIHYGDKAIWGMQNHEFKLVVDSVEGESFYDLKKDPKERNNLKDQAPRALLLMKNMLSRYIAQSTAPPRFDGVERQEAAELTEKLRALGYIN